MSGRGELEAFIAGVEALADMNEATAKAAEKPVAGVVRANVARGVAPDGTPWPEKVDGGAALRGAAAAVQSSTKGAAIVLSVGAPYVFHNFGAGGSSQTAGAKRERKRSEARRTAAGSASKFHAPRRQILPDAGEPVPEPMGAAVREAAEKVFRKAVG